MLGGTVSRCRLGPSRRGAGRGRSTTTASAPGALTVPVGTTVTWTNRDSEGAHRRRRRRAARRASGQPVPGYRRQLLVHLRQGGDLRLPLLPPSPHDWEGGGEVGAGARLRALPGFIFPPAPPPPILAAMSVAAERRAWTREKRRLGGIGEPGGALSPGGLFGSLTLHLLAAMLILLGLPSLMAAAARAAGAGARRSGGARRQDDVAGP